MYINLSAIVLSLQIPTISYFSSVINCRWKKASFCTVWVFTRVNRMSNFGQTDINYETAALFEQISVQRLNFKVFASSFYKYLSFVSTVKILSI